MKNLCDKLGAPGDKKVANTLKRDPQTKQVHSPAANYKEMMDLEFRLKNPIKRTVNEILEVT